MKRILFLFILCLPLWASAQQIEWISWNEAVALAENGGNTKKIFIDVYTDWCGYCKKMDAQTFADAEVARYMSENFLMVKFNAESKEPIEFRGRTFKYVPRGSRGYHELAVVLLNGKLSYPTVVFMDEKMTSASPVPGFRPAADFLPIARYYGESEAQTEGPRPVRGDDR